MNSSVKVEPAYSVHSTRNGLVTCEEVKDEGDTIVYMGKEVAPEEPQDLAWEILDPWKEEVEIVAHNGAAYKEFVQEFSRVRFPQRHKYIPNRFRMVQEGELMPPILGEAEPIKFVLPDEAKQHLTEVFRAAADTQIAEIRAGDVTLSEIDIPRLRDRWLEISKDIMSGVPGTMPPLREVNHRIPLIDETKVYNYHLPRCPDAMKNQLIEKIDRYVKAGWWKAVQTDQAAPMLCIPKKTGLLRTAIDCRKRNENTHKDVTPFPDQDQIRLDCARAKYRSKIDMSDAYEQIRIVAEDGIRDCIWNLCQLHYADRGL